MDNLRVVDCHMHVGPDINDFKNLIRIMEDCKYDAISVMSLASGRPSNIIQNLLCMLLKTLYTDKKVYTFGALHYPYHGFAEPDHNFLEQAKRLLSMGFDGFKMIEGKPDCRKRTGIALDSELYDEFYAFVQEKQIPLLLHVADPEEFWDRDLAPSNAIEFGWFWGDGTFQSKEALYGEVDNMLNKFPRLNLVLAHFYFKSGSIAEASKFLDKWPTVKFDITPGTEMYDNFSKNPQGWREFFNKYQNRILFGTDSWSNNYQWSVDVARNVRGFLEKNGEFDAEGLGRTLFGIGLENDVLEKIYNRNFQAYVQKEPEPVDMKLVIEECKLVQNSVVGQSMSTEIEELLNKFKSII